MQVSGHNFSHSSLCQAAIPWSAAAESVAVRVCASQIDPSWSTLGAAHFRRLVEAGIYDGCRFFRVVPDFMVQFGLCGKPQLPHTPSFLAAPHSPLALRRPRHHTHTHTRVARLTCHRKQLFLVIRIGGIGRMRPIFYLAV